ncbi:hypothetical protein [Moorena bouillonii]|uniref:Uncharacterized protein n=1 Tax=Moorena bouillonii PNG TaxID=568701 RepID=A0A1U7MZ61_9CYAN|nr:hypothetical protein [Moorena bouillonii]OLT58944.1 hypothetical protein BJP37_07710 [Moorena bouillonii PNG]
MPGDNNTSRFNIGSGHINISDSVYNTQIRGYLASNVLYNLAPDYSLTAEAAAEIQQLLNQLSQTNSTTTMKDKMIVVGKVVDQIEINPTLKAKVINALKAGGIEAFKEAIDHPLVNILMAVIEGWHEVE